MDVTDCRDSDFSAYNQQTHLFSCHFALRLLQRQGIFTQEALKAFIAVLLNFHMTQIKVMIPLQEDIRTIFFLFCFLLEDVHSHVMLKHLTDR